MGSSLRNLGCLTDEELLVAVNEVASQSPIIGELAKRLEAVEARRAALAVDRSCECPICLGALTVDYDEANDIINLKVEK